MALVGDKNAARKLAKEVNVPTVPGSEGLSKAKPMPMSLAHEWDFRAHQGIGGRGRTRYARAVNDCLARRVAAAQAEAQAALERRHLPGEIQRASRMWKCKCWPTRTATRSISGERDCTMQRRHQKLIEGKSAPSLPNETRTAMCEAP